MTKEGKIIPFSNPHSIPEGEPSVELTVKYTVNLNTSNLDRGIIEDPYNLYFVKLPSAQIWVANLFDFRHAHGKLVYHPANRLWQLIRPLVMTSLATNIQLKISKLIETQGYGNVPTAILSEWPLPPEYKVHLVANPVLATMLIKLRDIMLENFSDLESIRMQRLLIENRAETEKLYRLAIKKTLFPAAFSLGLM